MRTLLSPRLLLAALVALCLPGAARAITYADWIASYGLTGADAAKLADPDGDGAPNLYEFAIADRSPIDAADTNVNTPRFLYAVRTGEALGEWTLQEITGQAPTTGLGGKYHASLLWTPRQDAEGITFQPEFNFYPGRAVEGTTDQTLRLWLSGSSCFYYQQSGGQQQATTIMPVTGLGRFFLRLAVSDSTYGSVSYLGTPVELLNVNAPLATQRVTVEGTAPAPITTYDASYVRTTGATSVSDFTWQWSPATSLVDVSAVVRSTSDAAKVIPTLGDPFKWTWIGDGAATLTLTTATGNSYHAAVTAATSMGSTVDTFTGWASGSLAEYLSGQIDSLLTAAGPTPDLFIYSTRDYTTQTFVKNTACWAASYDFSGVSVYQSFLGEANAVGQFRPLTLITPQHGIAAAHFGPLGTSTIKFLGSDGIIYSRTVGAAKTITYTQANGTVVNTDLQVVRLSSPLPSAVKWYKVLPADVTTTKLRSLVGYSAGRDVPIVALTQEKRATVRNLYGLSLVGSVGYYNGSTLPTSGVRATAAFELRGGDSGNPSFAVLAGEPVFVGSWHGVGAAPSPSGYISAINTAIGQLDTAAGGATGYTVTTADLSAWPTY